MDVFILNMNNTTVQERLCTEPKEHPEEALRFAVAFEEGVKRQKSYGKPSAEVAVKTEPVYNVDQAKGTCFRCGWEFTPEHLKQCKAKTEKCSKCGLKGHFARVCQKGGRGGKSRQGQAFR